MVYNYSYKFTEKAESDLDAILQYISEDLSNPTAANSLAVNFFNTINNVLAFPTLGKEVENEYLSDKNIRRMLIIILFIIKLTKRKRLFT